MRTGYTKLIDFWTLGVFIYELATSDSPFRHDEILTRSTFKEKVERAEVDRDWKGHSLNEELKDLINKLLKFKPEQRLGAKGFDEIKSHSFFKDIDWLKLLNKQMESPILPLITEHPIKISALKNKGFIKKTISFDFEKD
jgi:serum/glucocorticoid-regulated kinase 2